MKLIKKYFLLVVMALAVVLICGCDIKPSTSTTKLATPTNLNYANDYVLEWDAVENATGYTVLIGSHSINVTETEIDLNEYLNEGKNNVWVTATSTNSSYSQSDAAGILVDYSTFKSTYLSKLIGNEYEKAFEYKKANFKSDLEFTAYCIDFAEENIGAYAIICNGVAVTPAQVVALDKIAIFMNQMIDQEATPTVQSVFEIIDAIRDSEISHRNLAQITYNIIELYMNSMVYELDTDIDINTVLSLVLANESLTVDTLEVVYEYLDKALADTEKALNDQTVTNQVAEIIKAFFGTNRPTVDKFATLTTFVKTAINALVSANADSNPAVKVLPDAFNLVLAVIDPTLDMVNKAATVLSNENYQTLATSVSTIVQSGMTIYNGIIAESLSKEDLATNIQAILANIETIATTISTAAKEVDFTKELTAIQTAVEKFVKAESVKSFAKEVAIATIAALTEKTEAEAEAILTSILEVISKIDSEDCITEETVQAVLEALGMTTEQLTEKIMDLIASLVVGSFDTPENVEGFKKVLEGVKETITDLKNENGQIQMMDLISLAGEDVVYIVNTVFPDVFDGVYVSESGVALLETLLEAINEKANLVIKEMSDGILEKYVGTWSVSSDETNTPLFSYVYITTHSIYLEDTRANNVKYSGNDYYGYTVYVGENEYYVSLSGDNLIVGSSKLEKETRYTKATSDVPEIPWNTFEGTYTGTANDGTTFTVVIKDETIKVNDSSVNIISYDEYEGFTIRYNDTAWYIMSGYTEAQIMIVSSDYSTYATLTKGNGGSSTTPSVDLSELAKHTGSYTGNVGGESFTIVITENSITINDEVVTIVAFEDGSYMVKTSTDVEWYIGLSYGTEKILFASTDFQTFGFLTIVTE